MNRLFAGIGAQQGAKSRRARCPRGLTMLEIIVVILIISILSAGLVSGIAKVKEHGRLNASISTVANMISLARNRAIADNAVYHVRVENKRLDEQFVSVYYFPKLSDGLRAGDEYAIQEPTNPFNLGWNDSFNAETVDFSNIKNYIVSRKPLTNGTFFETQYDGNVLWKNSKVVPMSKLYPRKKKPADLDPFLPFLYSGHWADVPVVRDPPEDSDKWKNYYPVYKPDPAGNAANLLPKVTPAYKGAPTFPAIHQALFFYPDGTASGTILILIRTEDKIGYVQVFKGGMIRSGVVRNLDELKDLG